MLPTADTDHTRRSLRLSRAPGILLLAAALITPISGAMAFDADSAALLPPEPATATVSPATPTAGVAPAPTPAPATDQPAPSAAAPHPGVATGDELDDAEREAFLQWVAAQQAAGKHRGIAVYASW